MGIKDRAKSGRAADAVCISSGSLLILIKVHTKVDTKVDTKSKTPSIY